MAGDDGSESGDTTDWSREVAASEPIEFDFADGAAAAPAPDESPNLDPHDLDSRHPDSQHPDSQHHDRQHPGRRWRAAVGATVALVAVGGAIAAADWSGDQRSADEPAPTVDETPTSLSALPAVPTTDDDGAARRGEGSVGEIDFDGQLEQFPTDSPTYSALPRGWRSSSVDVPSELADIGATTMVILTADGVVREVDFPSGVTRDFAVGVAEFVEPTIAVGRSATLVPAPSRRANPAGQPFSMLRAGEQPVDVLVPLQSTQLRERPGTDEFAGLGVDFAASSVARLMVGGDGSVSTEPIAFGPELSRGVLDFGPSGRTIVTDGGAVFERSDGGNTTLVADGELIAASSHHVLTRNCTDQYVCNGVLVDGTTGERTTVRLDPTFTPSLADGSAQVSPDGRWLRYRTTAFQQVDRVLDLDTGEITTLPSVATAPVSDRNDVWASDSSGFFRLDGSTLEFRSVATGTGIALDALGPVVDFGVRLDLTGTPSPPVIPDAGVDLQLVVVDEIGSFHDLDLRTGQVTSYLTTSPRTHSDRPVVITDGAEAYAAAYDRGPSTRLDRIGGAVAQDDDPYDPVVHRGPRMNTLWEPVRADDVIRSYRLTGVNGEHLFTEIGVPDGISIVGGDVTAGLVGVSESGDVSLLQPDTAQLLAARGELLGLGSSTMIVRECDGDGGCQDVSVDRASGERTPTEAPAIASPQATIVSGSGSIVESTVSPDGTVLIGATSNGPLAWIATDLTTGAVVDIGSVRAGSRIVWTDDSTHAVYHSRNSLYVYDRAAGRVSRLRDAPRVLGFTVR